MNAMTALAAGVMALMESCFRIRPYDVPPGTDIFAVAEGTWDWGGRPGTCRDNPHRISFSADRAQMILSFSEPFDSVSGKQVATYRIHHVTRHSIRGFMLDETRRTAGGELVVWDLVLTSPNSYRWRQTDWPAAGYTGEVVRCEAGAGNGQAAQHRP